MLDQWSYHEKIEWPQKVAFVASFIGLLVSAGIAFIGIINLL